MKNLTLLFCAAIKSLHKTGNWIQRTKNAR